MSKPFQRTGKLLVRQSHQYVYQVQIKEHVTYTVLATGRCAAEAIREAEKNFPTLRKPWWREVHSKRAAAVLTEPNSFTEDEVLP